MSTQDPNAGVPIAILPDNELQHCRLLELPAELLTLVTSANPPVLQLKSIENVDGTAKNANTVLCTPDKTYDIRQVSTSNTVFLTRSVERSDEGGGLPQTGVDAVAKCDSTLELISASKQSAVPFIKAALPTFTSTGTYSTQKAILKADLFSHIPLSDVECGEGWTELACFESVNPPGSFIPSAKVRIEIWHKALTAATAEQANITDAFIADDIPAFALDLREDWSTELLSAVFAAMSSSTAGGNLAIVEEKCIRFVGLALLEARSGGRSTSTNSFIKAWKDSVPESWRDKCELPVLQGSCNLQDNDSLITFVDGTATGSATVAAATDAKSTLGAKRKWHEKFRPSKEA